MSKKSSATSKHNVTKKNTNKTTTEGWKVISISGNAHEMGIEHGEKLYRELRRLTEVFPVMIERDFKISMSEYLKTTNELIKPTLKQFPEIHDEIRGISEGAKNKGVDISVDFLISWNGYLSLYSHYLDGKSSRCSAFIATGESTQKGDIVMAHNTHCDFICGLLQNIIIYVYPSDGFPFVMQTCAGLVWSSTDWFICSSGIIGCESTIANIKYKPVFGAPVFCRIRNAMQYGKSLDDYISIMKKDNAGDYACSWLLGDINTNEIMLFELGLKTDSVHRTKNGIFYGMNSAIDNNLRNRETNDTEFHDLETSSGSRNYRLNSLLNDKYRGDINAANAKKILSDHYDSFLDKTVMNKRGICKHQELDPNSEKPYGLYGAMDGKAVDSGMAKKMQFTGRFGSSCGRVFSLKKHMKQHPEHKKWEKYLSDIPKYNWTKISPKKLN